ncbi:haloacid dehalogenase-like hydrolase [Candidatus Woesearchaeota archaeon]|nr:haloacid dehalogenase-like hydrolase [Candidatus Woesearchaeota archaeon]
MQLDYLVKPTKANNRSFVLSKLSKKDVKEKIRNSRHLVSDLDDTLIHSPTFNLAVSRFMEEGYLEPEHYSWIAKAIFKCIFQPKKAVSEMWFEYHERFGHKFRHFVNSQKFDFLFYPGVQEFFNSLPETTEKIMVTRTIEEIARPFANHLGFGKYHHLEKKESPFLKTMLGKEQSVFIDDSNEGEETVIALNGNENSPLTIYVASSPKKVNEHFAVSIGRDYSGLNKIINSD